MNDDLILDADTITVSLGKHEDHDVLIVDDKNDANDRGKKSGRQKIAWRLDNSLQGATFVPLDAAKPGFEWISWPPPKPDIFHDRKVLPSGDLTIEDLHETKASDGLWFYKLRVLAKDGNVYETTLGPDSMPATDPDAPCVRTLLSKNPIIINR